MSFEIDLPETAQLLLFVRDGNAGRLVAADALIVDERRASEILSVSRTDLYRYRREGILPFVHPPGSTAIRYRFSDLVAFADRWKGPPHVENASPVASHY